MDDMCGSDGEACCTEGPACDVDSGVVCDGTPGDAGATCSIGVLPPRACLGMLPRPACLCMLVVARAYAAWLANLHGLLQLPEQSRALVSVGVTASVRQQLPVSQ